MISRYLVILVALIAAIFRYQQGEWLAASGLAFLALGLALLKLADGKPRLKPFAFLSFGMTALVMIVVFIQMR
jgi:hypothetical protein